MRPTLLVRQIMQQNGKNMIYTNLYKTCRTVKCYQGRNDNTTLLQEIKTKLDAAGIPFTVNYTFPKTKYFGSPALIVRLPL